MTHLPLQKVYQIQTSFLLVKRSRTLGRSHLMFNVSFCPSHYTTHSWRLQSSIIMNHNNRSGTTSVPLNPCFILPKLCILFLLFNNCILKWTNIWRFKSMIQKKSSLLIQNAFPKMHSMILRNARFSPKTIRKPLF